MGWGQPGILGAEASCIFYEEEIRTCPRGWGREEGKLRKYGNLDV